MTKPVFTDKLPDHEKNIILSYLTGRSPAEISYLMDRDQLDLTEDQADRLDRILEERLAGRPLQYAIGYWNFYGRDFIVDPRALIPRPETELLVERVLAELEERRAKGSGRIDLCDVGTGTGAIALTLYLESLEAERHLPARTDSRRGMNGRDPDPLMTNPDATSLYILGTDISEEALSLAEENENFLARASADRLKYDIRDLSGRISLQWKKVDLLEGIDRKFDLIVSNPPYVEEKLRGRLQKELAFEPASALYAGEDGLAIYRRLIPQSIESLKSGGKLLIEIGASQAGRLTELLTRSGYKQIQIVKDYAGLDRMMIASV